jgi:RNA polymerase sigma-70 factor (ECF subfamily)
MFTVLERWSDSDSFEHVLARARNGDEVAFARLWRWLNPSVLRWLRVVAPDEADDVSSEAWCTIARKIGEFGGGEDEFRGWVYVTTRRRAIDAARHRGRQPSTAGLDGLEPASSVDASTPTLEEQEVDSVLAILRELPAQQAEVLALRIVGGLTVGETAAVVGKTDVAVRVLCHRGLRTLARRMSETEILEGVTQ